MKRIWTLLVLAVLALSLFAASCNDTGGGGGKGKAGGKAAGKMNKKSSGDEEGGDATSD